MLDEELRWLDEPKKFNEKAWGHIIEVLDMHCADYAKRLIKEGLIEVGTIPSNTFNPDPSSFSTYIKIVVHSGWDIGNISLPPKQSFYVIAQKATPQQTKNIKNWFVMRASTRNWMRQIISLNRSTESK